jgi:hypothetical protein
MAGVLGSIALYETEVRGATHPGRAGGRAGARPPVGRVGEGPASQGHARTRGEGQAPDGRGAEDQPYRPEDGREPPDDLQDPGRGVHEHGERTSISQARQQRGVRSMTGQQSPRLRLSPARATRAAVSQLGLRRDRIIPSIVRNCHRDDGLPADARQRSTPKSSRPVGAEMVGGPCSTSL